ncbi:MAG: flagellar hook basal-body protein [bacterium]
MTTTGMTSAANALRYWERRQEVTANNLANVSTDGFKAERVFARLLDGVPVMGTHTDRRDGSIRQTGQATDVAIGGDGFFVVNTPAGERFTRGGSLKIDPSGFLSDQDGNPLLGSKGTIQIGDGIPSIDKQGNVAVNGQIVDQLRLETAPAGATLEHEGGTRFIPGANRMVVAADQRDIRQGHLEESNADSLGGLVDMISVQRAYAAVEKTISVLDHVREVGTSQLGRPAN